jgi:hypothetical protein
MTTDLAPIEESYAVFVGDGGEDYEREQASGVFEKGKSYRVKSRIMYRWSTMLELDGVDGEWDPRLFKGDLSHAPLRKELGFPQMERRTPSPQLWIAAIATGFLVTAFLLWIWIR